MSAVTGVLDVAWARAWVLAAAAAVADAKDELTELDRQIGDSDHGVNMDRGFQAVAAKVPDAPAETVGDVLKLVATTLMSTVGGAAGPLYGTAFLRAAKVTAVPELGPDDVVALLEAALEGLVARGKAAVGEKTMVDAWTPAAAAAAEARDAGADPTGVLEAALRGAEEGAASTVPLLATKGRASYLGERSQGHLDPGARSTVVLLTAAIEVARG
ncbi:dihydroxyacetone kinase subunit DhaL [Sanguibacter sp. HDW7]|uniref:dihydroxyacetone kinase subunit DhaL n=1 Tax=Sanguibacter sp. HDW7 TaxID=2714931 RepID=UPI001981B018|nr:dihydroxyacetone kinase subunit DhaL [Sanguibacter sp. HDW7]